MISTLLTFLADSPRDSDVICLHHWRLIPDDNHHAVHSLIAGKAPRTHQNRLDTLKGKDIFYARIFSVITFRTIHMMRRIPLQIEVTFQLSGLLDGSTSMSPKTLL